MATETEKKVLNLLSMIEVPHDAAERIEKMGPEAVNVACETALGTYVGLPLKVRTNAASVVGRMANQQALETLALLITDPVDDVSIRALRAVGRREEPELAERAALVLLRPDASPLVVAEAVRALAASPQAAAGRDALDKYRKTGYDAAPAHRRSLVVERALDRANG